MGLRQGSDTVGEVENRCVVGGSSYRSGPSNTGLTQLPPDFANGIGQLRQLAKGRDKKVA